MKINNSVEIVKLCFTPFSIISPIPFFCIFLFLISTKFSDLTGYKLYVLFLGIITTLISSGASNFWNHTNDIVEDTKNGKKTILTQNIINKKESVLISILLYLFSIIIIVFASIYFNRPIYIFFLIWAGITWLYSDDIFLKKIIGIRLKTHYIGEILTYSIAYPAYTMSIWLIFSDSMIKGMVLSIIFLCFGLAGVLLKDLKDIKGDREAGLKTLGVVFSPIILIKVATHLLILYFIIIITAIFLNIFSIISLILIIPFFYLLNNTFLHFHRKKWTLELTDSKNIKSMVFSTYSSILLLGLLNFI